MYDGQWTYTWEHGRELTAMSRGATTWTYTYDANGMRTRRTDGVMDYRYVYNGSQLSQLTVIETWDGSQYVNTLYFTYSADGTPLTVTCEGCTYYYVTNIQGDVIAVLDDIGRLVCRYVYDAWGNVTTYGERADNVSYYNPLRYRGYVYDEETELYYLQSRYYSPKIGRFLNADALVSTGQGPIGNNMFAYCLNNPVNLLDKTGRVADSYAGWIGEQLGEWLSPYIQPFIKNFKKSLAGSWNASVEFGSGFGVKGKVGPVSVEADAIIVADEWSFDADGKTDEVRKASITVQAELIDNINLGVDASYYVPLEAGEGYGLLCAPGGEADVVIGAYVYDFGVGYKTFSIQDIEISFGLSGYFILGGGFEIGINLSEFIRIWNS